MCAKRLLNPYDSKSKYNDIRYIGQQFWNFVIVDFTFDKDERFAFKCLCKCQEGKPNPKYNIILPSKLINGKHKSCGCQASGNLEKEKYKQYVGKVFGCLKILEVVKGIKNVTDGTQLRCKCIHCGDERLYTARDILSRKRTLSSGNKECKHKIGAIHSKYYDSSYIGKVYNYLEVIDILPISSERLGAYWKCRCTRDDNIIEVNASRVVRGNNVSCGCLNSIAEPYIKEILDKYEIKYKSQKSFPNLKGVNGGLLRYDFAILDKDKNLLCLLEYDGAQHRTPEEMPFGTKEERLKRFKILKEHDRRKDDYAEKLHIPLYRIYVRDLSLHKNKLEEELRKCGII